MIDRIWHNSPSPIQCLRAFPFIVLRLFTFPLLLLQSLQNPKILLLLPLPLLSYYFATKHFAADIKFPGVVELSTQLLILENILWLSLCRINKFGLNTLPSKTVAISYSCGLSTTRPRKGTTWSRGRRGSGLITHKYGGSQQLSRVEYSTQIYRFDTRGAKEYSWVLAVELSIQPHLDNLVSTAKCLVAKVVW